MRASECSCTTVIGCARARDATTNVRRKAAKAAMEKRTAGIAARVAEHEAGQAPCRRNHVARAEKSVAQHDGVQ